MQLEVRQELLDATNIFPQWKDETDNQFKYRLLAATDELEDEQFFNLSEATQNWVEAGIQAIKDSGHKNPDTINFPKFPEDAKKEREEDDDVVDNPETGKRVRQKKKPAVERSVKKQQSWDMKSIIFKNPDISWPALIKKLNDMGYNPSKDTVQIALSNCRQDLKVLKHLGMLKE